MNATILLVDDDDSGLFFLNHAISRVSSPATLQYVSNGLRAIQYLLRQAEFTDDILYPLPAVVLLDLKMPLMTGFDVLKRVHHEPSLKCLPVVVWSSSDREEDKCKAFALGARGFFPKPLNLDGYSTIVLHLEAFLYAGVAVPMG